MLANESAETFVPVGFKFVKKGFRISGIIGETTSVCNLGALLTGFNSSVGIFLTVETSVIE